MLHKSIIYSQQIAVKCFRNTILQFYWVCLLFPIFISAIWKWFTCNWEKFMFKIDLEELIETKWASNSHIISCQMNHFIFILSIEGSKHKIINILWSNYSIYEYIKSIYRLIYAIHLNCIPSRFHFQLKCCFALMFDAMKNLFKFPFVYKIYYRWI